MEGRQSCFARMLDVRGFVIAARGATLRAEPAALILMIAVFGFISLLLAPFWFAFDLNSTWEFTTSLRDASASTINEVAGQVDSALNITLGALIAGVLLTGYTLLPSLFELAFPTVQHPLLNILLVAAIIFDYVTDWPKSWATTGQWGGAENPIAHVLYAVLFCLFVSVGVQAVLVICLTIVLFSLLGLARGGRGSGRATTIIEG